jgi:hypothetical protein
VLEQDISAPGVHMIDGLFTAMDPGRNFNPDKIIPNSPLEPGIGGPHRGWDLPARGNTGPADALGLFRAA